MKKRLEGKLDDFIYSQDLKNIVNKIDFNNEVGVYLASGSMFSQLSQVGLELLAGICEMVNLNYYLPQHADFNDKSTDSFIITNKMIADGDIAELEKMNFLFAHIEMPIDEGVAGEISRFARMSETQPDKYYGVVGWVDDIRMYTEPNPKQYSYKNQTGYVNSYVVGEIERSLGCYHSLGSCFRKMYHIYKTMKR